MPPSPAEVPELTECLGAFQVRFRRPAGAQAWERDPTGRLTELPHKTCDTLARAVPVMLADSCLVWRERRRQRNRHTLPAIPREVARWLCHQAVQWWVTTDRFMDRCCRTFSQSRPNGAALWG